MIFHGKLLNNQMVSWESFPNDLMFQVSKVLNYLPKYKGHKIGFWEFADGFQRCL